MLSEKHSDSSQNPLLIQAAHNALAHRREREANDPALLAKRAGVECAPWQADVLRSDARQVCLLASRQSGKSLVTALLALWTAIYSPKSLTLILAPALRQSQLMHRTIRQLHAALPDAPSLYEESALRIELANGSRVVALPGSEKTVRGYSGVDLLICDEASRIDDALYYSVRPMVAVSQGRIVLLSTPFGRRGFYHDVYVNGGPEWFRTKVTAPDCPRIPRDFLEQEQRAMPAFFYRSEYLCEFTDTLDSVFAYEDIQRALSDEVKPLFGKGD